MPDVKFLMDVHVHSAITAGVRRRGIEAITCQEMNLGRARDIEIVAFAAQNEYVIFSQDTDFLNICSTQFPHAGLVYSHKRQILVKL